MERNDAFAEFGKMVAADETLQNRLRTASSPDAFVAAVVSIGKQKGFDFAPDEVRARLAAPAPAGEMSDEQLDRVAGGMMVLTSTWVCCGILSVNTGGTRL